MVKPTLSDTELKILIDNKLEEDIIIPLIINNRIVELHKPDGNIHNYRIRVADFEDYELNKILKDGRFYMVSEWIMIDDISVFRLISKAREYIEGFYFDF